MLQVKKYYLTFFDRTLLKCGESNNIRFFIIQFMEKNKYLTSYEIDRVRGIVDLRGSSIFESNHASVKSFVFKNTEVIHDSMQQLMKQQHKLMMNNNDIIVKEYPSLKVINLQHSYLVDENDIFLFRASKLKDVISAISW